MLINVMQTLCENLGALAIIAAEKILSARPKVLVSFGYNQVAIALNRKFFTSLWNLVSLIINTYRDKEANHKVKLIIFHHLFVQLHICEY